jgi:hypothetical protein
MLYSVLVSEIDLRARTLPEAILVFKQIVIMVTVKEGLIYSDLPAVHGCAAKIGAVKALILRDKRK